MRVDRGGEIDVAGNLAPDGVVGPYRQPEASVATLREIFAPVELLAPRSGVLDDRFDGILRIANRHDFTDLSTLRIDWRLLDLPSPWTPTPEPAVAAQGTVRPPASAPGTEARIDLGLPPDWRRHDALAIDAVAADGRVVRSWSLPLRSVREVRRGLVVGGAQPPPVQRIESAEAIRLIARDVEVAIDRGTGELIEVRTPAGPVPLTGGPRLGDATPVAVDAEARADGDAQEVGVRYRDPLRSAWWRLEPSGWLRLRYRYEVTGEQSAPRDRLHLPARDGAGDPLAGPRTAPRLAQPDGRSDPRRLGADPQRRDHGRAVGLS